MEVPVDGLHTLSVVLGFPDVLDSVTMGCCRLSFPSVSLPDVVYQSWTNTPNMDDMTWQKLLWVRVPVVPLVLDEKVQLREVEVIQEWNSRYVVLHLKFQPSRTQNSSDPQLGFRLPVPAPLSGT